MKTYEGKLTISRIQGGDVDQGIEIAVRDEKSHIEFFLVRISLEEFAKGLFNLCERPCVFELRGVDKVGWVHQHKDVCVPIAHGYGPDFVARMRDEVSCYCTDGWEARDYDLQYNMHRIQNEKMLVTLHRYVKE
jgi:hypothetical protein